MGFLSKLGKIGGIVGGGLATAFTGGAASPLLGAALGMGGKVAGDLAASRGQGRVDEMNANLTMAGEKDRAMLQRAGLDLQRRNYASQEQRRRMSDIMRGDAISRMGQSAPAQRPAGVPVMSFRGGLNANSLGPNARQGGEAMSRMALETLMAGGDKFDDVPMQDYDAMMPKAGILDKILGIAGPAASLSSGMMGLGRSSAPKAAGVAPPSANAAYQRIKF